MSAYEQFRQLDTPDGTHLAPCPVCGAVAGLWRYSEAADAPTATVVMCSNEAPIGPQDGRLHEGCLLYMPSDDFYRATIREAVGHWNAFAYALTNQRRRREQA
jgi:hypothetical protein